MSCKQKLAEYAVCLLNWKYELGVTNSTQAERTAYEQVKLETLFQL